MFFKMTDFLRLLKVLFVIGTSAVGGVLGVMHLSRQNSAAYRTHHQDRLSVLCSPLAPTATQSTALSSDPFSSSSSSLGPVTSVAVRGAIKCVPRATSRSRRRRRFRRQVRGNAPVHEPDPQHATILVLGDSVGEAMRRLFSCSRHKHLRHTSLSSLTQALHRLNADRSDGDYRSASHQLLLHVHGSAAEDMASLSQLLSALRVIFDGFSLVYATSSRTDSSRLRRQLETLRKHGCSPTLGEPHCRWSSTSEPLVAEARRLNSLRRLLDKFAYSKGGETPSSVSSSYSPTSSGQNLSVAASSDAAQVSAPVTSACEGAWCWRGQRQTHESSEQQLHALAEEWCRREARGSNLLLDVWPEAETTRAPPVLNKIKISMDLNDLLPSDIREYDKNRPPKHLGSPTLVYYHVTVITLDSINEASMTYVADIFLAQSWRDHRLRLPSNMTEEYRILDVSWLNNIWRPDCFFKNAKSVSFHEMTVPNHYLWLYRDKTLLYMTKLTLVLSCAMKFQTFPHDTQSCKLLIESLSHTTDDLVFRWNETDPLVVNSNIELPQLDILRNTTEDCTLAYTTGNFTCLAVHFILRRRLGYHLFHTYTPSALIVVMSWISFWIMPEAIPARITLGITSLLVLATQNQQTQQSLPPVSYVKAVDVWMSTCSVFVFSTLMEYAVVNHFMGHVATKASRVANSSSDNNNRQTGTKNSQDSRVNVELRRAIFGYMQPGTQTTTTAERRPQYVTYRHGRESAIRIDKVSRVAFPLCFTLFNIWYWVQYIDLE